jgi:hypothetical protein
MEPTTEREVLFARAVDHQHQMYAAKFFAETGEGGRHPEPTDAEMAKRFAGCVRVPKPDQYPAIRAAILGSEEWAAQESDRCPCCLEPSGHPEGCPFHPEVLAAAASAVAGTETLDDFDRRADDIAGRCQWIYLDPYADSSEPVDVIRCSEYAVDGSPYCADCKEAAADLERAR